jgi:hypothetical protein
MLIVTEEILRDPNLLVNDGRPTNIPKIDWSNKLTDNLEFCSIFTTNHRVNLVNNVPLDLNNVSNFDWKVNGLYQTSTSATTAAYIDTGITSKSIGTILAKLTPDSFYNYVSLWDLANGGANDFESWIYSTGVIAARYDSTDTRCEHTLPDTSTFSLAFQWSKGITNGSNLYIDGDLKATQNTSNDTSPLTYNIGLYGSNTGNYGGKITLEYFYIYDRYLSPEEIKDIYLNPYQILEPA